jgi:large subunit ribosomal protein L9
MKVILKEKNKNLGEMGKEVEVADGYAINYLIPKNLAVAATKANRASFENMMWQKRRKMEKSKNEAQSIADTIEAMTLTFEKKAGEGEKLFGSVTTQEIADKLKESSIDVDKKKIESDHPIKTIGLHKVTIRLHADVLASLNVEVIKEAEEEVEETVEEEAAEASAEEVAETEEVPEEETEGEDKAEEA